MNSSDIISRLPYSDPFLFVDEILSADENQIDGKFCFRKGLDFYKGHFKDNPVTPGVILTECMAQIGLAAFGLFLMGDDRKSQISIAFTSSQTEFLKPVFPGETVVVRAKKVYFRFGKLKCETRMLNEQEEVVCTAVLSGMIVPPKTENHERA